MTWPDVPPASPTTSWPAAVAVLAAAAATGDECYLDLLRPALDTMIENGKVMAFADADSSLPVKWYPQLGEAVTTPTMLVPFRHSAPDGSTALSSAARQATAAKPPTCTPSSWPPSSTPTNSSWLNRVEAQFTALRYFTVGIRDGLHEPSLLPLAVEALKRDGVAADLSHQLSQQGQRQPFPVRHVGTVLADDAR